jgi:drug/metabolite transporter (DMT)-like permease
MKSALAHMSALDFAALRLWLATILLFATLVVLRRPLRVARPGAVAVTGLLQTGLTTALTLWALTGGSAGKNAVLCYAMPFWVVLLAWPMLGERPSRRQWLALALAAAGLGLLVSGGVQGTIYDLGALGSGMVWALGIVLTKRLQAGQATDILTLSAWQTLVGGIFAAVLAWCFPGRPVEWSPVLIFALAYNALLVYGVMWFLWFWVLERLDTGIASLGTLIVPVVGMLAGVALLGERPSTPEWVGSALVVGALLITASVAARGGR